MHLSSWKWAVVAGALAVAPVAARADWYGGSPVGNYLLIGGGATAFTDSTTKEVWDTGGTWDLRWGTGLKSFLGFEAAYVGAYNPAKTGNADLLSNGANAVLRLQYPIASGDVAVEPFVFGGIGWRYLSVRNAPAGAKDTDNLGEVPFGAGVTIGMGRFLVDARFTYRTTFSEDLGGPGGTLKMQNWAVNGAIGVAF
jgi:hypothetical protein